MIVLRPCMAMMFARRQVAAPMPVIVCGRKSFLRL